MLPEFTGLCAPLSIRIGENRPGQIVVFRAPDRSEWLMKSDEPPPEPRKQFSQTMSVGEPPLAALMKICAFGFGVAVQLEVAERDPRAAHRLDPVLVRARRLVVAADVAALDRPGRARPERARSP